jgi:hypothetical protein
MSLPEFKDMVGGFVVLVIPCDIFSHETLWKVNDGMHVGKST